MREQCVASVDGSWLQDRQFLTCVSCVLYSSAEESANPKKSQISWNFAASMSLLELLGVFMQDGEFQRPDDLKSDCSHSPRQFLRRCCFALVSGLISWQTSRSPHRSDFDDVMIAHTSAV